MSAGNYPVGPYYVTDTADAIRVRQESSDAVLASMDDGGHPEIELVPYADQLATAHLFAAAPELLEGAQDTLKALKLLRIGLRERAPETIAVIDAHISELEYAITKATGAA